ncbi:acyltransferase [Acidobacteria bacterium AB60]|nr:acyltransferase [Acidobacteria bacterium AB60]
MLSRLRRKDLTAVPRVSFAAQAIELDGRDTIILKGVAISLIVLHNFFHAVSPAEGNEFAFHPGDFAVFLDAVRHPSLAIQAMFSFFGYLGVPIFIFLSAYGLAKSHWEDEASWTAFLLGRIRKLFPVFGLVILPWMLGEAVHVGVHTFATSVVPQIALMLSGVSPLVPGGGMPPVGPWWFIPFILEFYALFFALRWLTKEFGWAGLVVLALAGVAISSVAEPVLAPWKINLYETPLGRLPTLCLGIGVARYPLRVKTPLVVLAGAVLLLGNEFRSLWPFTFTAASVLALWGYMELRGLLRESRTLARLGRYSILIFLLNGIVRDDLVRFARTPLLQLLFGGISAAATITLAAMIQERFLQPATVQRGEGQGPSTKGQEPTAKEQGTGGRVIHPTTSPAGL